VKLEIRGETLALLREARVALTRDAGEHVTDDQLVQGLARAVLEGGTDPGRAAYQLAVHECPSCRATSAEGGGELVPVDETCAEMVRCDAQLVNVDPGTRVETSHPHVGAGGGSTMNPEQTENPGCNFSTGSSRRSRHS